MDRLEVEWMEDGWKIKRKNGWRIDEGWMEDGWRIDGGWIGWKGNGWRMD